MNSERPERGPHDREDVAANSAWLVLAVIAFSLARTAGVLADRAGRLAKATTATIRRTLIRVPA